MTHPRPERLAVCPEADEHAKCGRGYGCPHRNPHAPVEYILDDNGGYVTCANEKRNPCQLRCVEANKEYADGK